VTLRLAAAGDPRSAAAAPPTKRRPGGFRRARVSRSLVFSPSSSITCPPSSRSPVSSCLRRSRRFRLMLTDPTTRRPTTNPSAAAMATSSDAGPVSLGGISNRGIRTAGAATPQCRAMPARAPGRAEQIRAADMAWIRPSSTREREPRGNGPPGAGWCRPGGRPTRGQLLPRTYIPPQASGERPDQPAARALSSVDLGQARERQSRTKRQEPSEQGGPIIR
jgi:hypothetical protein